MTAETLKSNQASLPQLSGRLLCLYRFCWCALALAAVLTAGYSVFHSFSPLSVALLRTMKSAVLICVAGILFLRKPQDPVAALLALAFLMWTVTSSFDFETSGEVAQLLDRCRFVLFALALLLFPDGRWEPRWTRLAAVASVIVFLTGIAETLRLASTHVFLPMAVVCVLAGIGSLVARFRGSTDYALRQQLKWVAVGLSVGVSLILCARAAAFGRIIPAMPVLWEGMFQLGIIVVALGFLVSLLRYRLFDAETVISRSAAYATLTIALVATFGGTEAFIQNVGQDYLGMDVGGISGGMAAAVAAVLLSPLHARLTEWAEERFQPDLAQLKRQMPELLARLGTSSSTRRLAETVLAHINRAIHATRSALILDGRVTGADGVSLRDVQTWIGRSFREDSEWKARDDSDLIFPVRLPLGNGRLAAWLVLGPRPDGTLYPKEDLSAVRSILPSVHQDLVSAKAREKIALTIKRREELLRAQIGEIRARLQALETSTANVQPSGTWAELPTRTSGHQPLR